MTAELLATLASTSRFAAGALLVLAAGLKWLSPGYADAAFFAVTDGPLHSALLFAEFILGVSLLLSLFGGVEVVLGLLAYGAFSALNFWSAWNGANTCSCFGSLKVNPWVM